MTYTNTQDDTYGDATFADTLNKSNKNNNKFLRNVPIKYYITFYRYEHDHKREIQIVN